MVTQAFQLVLVSLYLLFSGKNYLEEIVGKVISIKDGNTIEVLIDDRPVRIRLNDIDCPEKNQSFELRAKQFTSDLVFGKVVCLVIKNTDKYDRKVGNVYTPDGRLLNYELFKAELY